jgi:hypothetical protein
VFVRKFVPASLAYLGLTVVMFWPLVRELRAGVPHDVGDPLLTTWILWWNAHALPFTPRWWNAPAYWPLPNFLAFSEHLAGLSIISTPLQWLGAGPQLAHNLLLLLSWPLSAAAAYALGWHLTGRHDAAFIAGLVFGFNPYRLEQTPHIQVLTCWWMPIALLALHRSLQAPARAGPWLLLFGSAWLVQALSNGYFLFYFSVLVALWVGWFAARTQTGRLAAAILLIWFVAGLIMVPVLLRYKAVADHWQLTRGFGEVVAFSGDVSSFVTAPQLLRWWPFRPETRPEQGLYPGAVAALLALAGVIAAITSPKGQSGARRTASLALLGVAVVFLAVVVVTFVIGPWQWQFGPFRMSARQVRKPLTIACVGLALALALDPRFLQAFRRRSALAFYAVATFICMSMCLGPSGQLRGEAVFEKPPYWWLMKLPGIENLRVPTRFAMVAMLPLAMTAALAFARLARRAPPRAQVAAATVCVALLVFDSWPRPIPVYAAPERFILPAAARDASVIEMPPGDNLNDDVAAMVRGISHHRPVVNGYTGYFPAPYIVLRDALREGDGAVLLALTTFGPLCVVIDTKRGEATDSRRIAESLGSKPIDPQGDYLFYVLPGTVTPAEARGVSVQIRQVFSPESSTRAVWAADGRLDTYWESAIRQQGSEQITIELAAEGPVSGIGITQSGRVGDYPRNLVIETSGDGRTWVRAWEGRTAGLAYLAAVRDVSRSRFSIPFTSRPARFVRLRQTASGTAANWSIAELDVIR